MIGPAMNASISLDDNRASSIITFEPSNVITVSNGAIVMVRSRKRNDSSPRTPKLPFAPSAVWSNSDSMPGTFTPQLRAASVYCTSRPRSASCGYRYGAAARASAGSIPGEIGDVVFVAVDVDDALGDLEVIDGKAAAVNRPRQFSMRLATRKGRCSWPLAARRTSVSVMRRVRAL